MGETSKQSARGRALVLGCVMGTGLSLGFSVAPAYAQTGPQSAVPSGTNIYIPPPPPADGCCDSTDPTKCGIASFPEEKRYLINLGRPMKFERKAIPPTASWKTSFPNCPSENPECIEYYAYNVELTRRRAEALINTERNRACASFPSSTRRSCDAAYDSIYQRVDEYFPYYRATDTGAVGPQTCLEALQTMADLIAYLAESASQMEKLRQMMAAVNLAVEPNAENAVVYPQDDTEYLAAKFLRMADATLALGDTSPEKMRNVLSQVFERMVRVYVAGSQQLTRDYPNIPYTGPEIKGFYQGYEPDLVNSKASTVLYLSEQPMTSLCYNGSIPIPASGTLRGIANPANWAYRWFKDASGGFREGTSPVFGGVEIFNHQCRGQVSGNGDLFDAAGKGALARGFIANLQMITMQIMQDNLKKGYIVKPATFNLLNECSQKETELVKMRRRVKASYDEIRAGQSAGAVHADCAEQVLNDGTDISDYLSNYANYKPQPAAPGGNGTTAPLKKVFGLQTRACVVASMQTQAEMQLALQYLYCTWRAVGRKFNDLVIQSISKNDSDRPQDLLLAPKRNWAEALLKPTPATEKPKIVGASPLASLPSLFLMLGLLVSILGSSCSQYTRKLPMTCTGYRPGGGGPYRGEVAGVCDNLCEPLKQTIADYQNHVMLADEDLKSTAATYSDAKSDQAFTEASDKVAYQGQTLHNAYGDALYDCKHNYTFTALEPHFGQWVRRSVRRRVRNAVKEGNTAMAYASCQCNLRNLETGDQFGTGDPTFIFAQLSLSSRRQRSGEEEPIKLAMEGTGGDSGMLTGAGYSQITGETAPGDIGSTGGSSGSSQGGGIRAGKFIETDPRFTENTDELEEDLGFDDLDEGEELSEFDDAPLEDLGQMEETISDASGDDTDLSDDANSSSGELAGGASGSSGGKSKDPGPGYLASRDRSRKTAEYGGNDFIAAIGGALGTSGASGILGGGGLGGTNATLLASNPSTQLMFGGAAGAGGKPGDQAGITSLGGTQKPGAAGAHANGESDIADELTRASDVSSPRIGQITDDEFERLLGLHPGETLFSRATRVYVAYRTQLTTGVGRASPKKSLNAR